MFYGFIYVIIMLLKGPPQQTWTEKTHCCAWVYNYRNTDSMPFILCLICDNVVSFLWTFYGIKQATLLTDWAYFLPRLGGPTNQKMIIVASIVSVMSALKKGMSKKPPTSLDLQKYKAWNPRSGEPANVEYGSGLSGHFKRYIPSKWWISKSAQNFYALSTH